MIREIENRKMFKDLCENFGDYPCKVCKKVINPVRCTRTRECGAWVKWFGTEWEKIREKNETKVN